MKACIGWLRLKREYKDLELCEKIIHDYAKHGTFKQLESIYDTSANTINRFIKIRIEEIKKLKPELYKGYRLARKKSKTRR